MDENSGRLRPVLVFTAVALLGGASLTAGAVPLDTPEDASVGDRDERKYDGRTIEEWIARWSEESFDARQEAARALVKIGEPAVPALISLIDRGDPHMGQAFQVLGEIGPAARDALPVMLRIAKAKDWPTPEGWAWNVSPRELVFTGLESMTWAAARLTPTLAALASDDTEEEGIRTRAAGALKGMGKTAVPVLRRLTRSSSAAVSERAHHALLAVTGEDPAEYFARVLEANPLDPNAPGYLAHTKGIFNSGRLHALTERVKTAQRESLEARPDAEVAFTLATIIQNQLLGTSLQWAVPVDGVASRSDRENPKESFHTLAEALRIGFESSKGDSQLRRDFGVALVKLSLLRGDWDGMNEMLKALGQEPIPAEDRPWLPAPPLDWSGSFRSEWKPCDETMRSGTCSFVVSVEKDGAGLQGAHVLIKEAPKPAKVMRTGIAADTLLFSPYPFGWRTFGYHGDDRTRTRYAVSDASGVVRFDRLPEMAVKIEILVPTSNFREAGSGWELWMEVSPGRFKLASMAPAEDAIGPHAPEAQVRLEAGNTVRYPHLVVRPRFTLNVHDWARVDPRSFDLTWPQLSAPPERGETTYELEMTLSAISEDPSFGVPPALRSAKKTVTANSWEIGRRGLDGLRLEPGNIYTLQVTARDDRDGVLARSALTRVWVPWEHRACDPPLVQSAGDRDAVPVTHGKWWRGSSTYGDGTQESLEQQMGRFLRERPRAFETEYVRMGKAWLDWRDGDLAGARKQLEELTGGLPKTSVAHATSAWLLARLKEGASCPKHLDCVPPAADDSTR